MSVRVTGKNLTIEDIVAVARHGEKIELDPAARERIVRCRAFLAGRTPARPFL